MGARAVLESIINKFKNAEISLSIVWINMLPGDSETAAEQKAGMFNDPRVRQFYDPNIRSGRTIADSVGCKGEVAWDIYLFYDAGLEWAEIPPQPSSWMHQLKDSWADRDHYRTGNDLEKELLNVMTILSGVKST